MKESAIEPLEIAAANDTSPMVRALASQAVFKIKDDLGIEEEALMVISVDESTGMDLKEIEEYVRKHFIIFTND